MEKPEKKNYDPRNIMYPANYTEDLNKYINQLEADAEDISDFIQFVISKNDENINAFSLIAYGAEYRTNNKLREN